jgi:hypothetical protein
MKAVINEKETKSETPFPKLMIHDDGTIVYFNSPSYGMTLFPKAGSSHGYISNSFSMKRFSDFTGTITLSND